MDLTAIILAGGKGTRLRPFTMTIPKPLLPLGDVPILEIVLRQLAAAGIKRIVITLGHMAPLFVAFVGDGSQWGLNVEYSQEEEPLGTAGPLLQIKDPGEDFLVMNGDLLTTINYGDLIASHKESKAWGTISTSRREVAIDYGVIETDASNRLTNYNEKPIIKYEVSMGIYVLSKRSLALIPANQRYDMPQLMLAIHGAGKLVNCYKSDCYWQDIGRFDDYQSASEDYVQNPSRFV